MTRGLVSVIVPTNNRLIMLQRAIASIQKQTYKNIEIIIIANGCIDNTSTIVGELESKYNNIRFLNFTEALGGAEARNRGLHIAQGEFIAFLDDDDEWIENKLEQQINILKENKYCIVGCNYIEVSPDKSKYRKLKENVSFYDMNFENVIGSYSFCITKSEYLENLFINKKLKASQDWDLWIKIFLKTNKKAYIIQDYLVKYYQHDNKISINYKNKIHAQNLFLSFWKKQLDEEAIDYQKIKILFYSFLANKNIKSYIFRLPFIIKAIYKSPYKFSLRKYYIYLNFFRYI